MRYNIAPKEYVHRMNTSSHRSAGCLNQLTEPNGTGQKRGTSKIQLFSRYMHANTILWYFMGICRYAMCIPHLLLVQILISAASLRSQGNGRTLRTTKLESWRAVQLVQRPAMYPWGLRWSSVSGIFEDQVGCYDQKILGCEMMWILISFVMQFTEAVSTPCHLQRWVFITICLWKQLKVTKST